MAVPVTFVAAMLEWSEREPAIAIATVEELDRALDSIEQRCVSGELTIAKIRTTDATITLGSGSPTVFVQLGRANDEPPYVVTVGQLGATGEAVFYFHGEHHTEIPQHNLIPALTAREVVREFFRTRRRSAAVAWEAI